MSCHHETRKPTAAEIRRGVHPDDRIIVRVADRFTGALEKPKGSTPLAVVKASL